MANSAGTTKSLILWDFSCGGPGETAPNVKALKNNLMQMALTQSLNALKVQTMDNILKPSYDKFRKDF